MRCAQVPYFQPKWLAVSSKIPWVDASTKKTYSTILNFECVYTC